MTLAVQLVDRVRDVPREAWDALAGPDPSPFVEHTWLDALETSGCVGEASGWIPRHVVVKRGSDVVAVAPTYVKTNSEGEFVYDFAWADLARRMRLAYYPKLVVGVPFTPATGGRALVAPGESRAELTHLLGEVLRRLADAIDASSVHVLFPDEAEAERWEDAGFRRRLGFQFHWENDGYASMDAFLARFDAKRRHQLRREMAQPARDGVAIAQATADELADPRLRDAMFTFYLATVDKFAWGRRYLNRPFFDQVCERFAERLAWAVARKDGAPIAGAFNVAKGPRLYGRYWGASVEMPFLHFNVCYYHGVRRCIDDGLALFEPGAGGEHKLARGFLPSFTHSAHLVRAPRLASVLYPFLEQEAEAVRNHVARERAEGPLRPR